MSKDMRDSLRANQGFAADMFDVQPALRFGIEPSFSSGYATPPLDSESLCRYFGYHVGYHVDFLDHSSLDALINDLSFVVSHQ